MPCLVIAERKLGVWRRVLGACECTENLLMTVHVSPIVKGVFVGMCRSKGADRNLEKNTGKKTDPKLSLSLVMKEQREAVQQQ